MLFIPNKYSYKELLQPLDQPVKAPCIVMLALLIISNPTITQAEDKLPDTKITADTVQGEQINNELTADNTTEQQPDQSSPCVDEQGQQRPDASWYDSTHAVMNTVFCEPALWFDSFFGSDRVIEEVGGTYVRWRNDFIYVEADGFRFNTNLNFSVELPKVSYRLKLTFEGDQDQDLEDVLPGDPAAADNTNTIGLRLDVKDTDRSKFNISVSARPRIRARYRYTYPVLEDFLIRFTQEIQNEEGVNSARTRIDFEKAFLPKRLFRATTEGVVAEDFSGLDWAQAFALFDRLSKKSSVSYELSTNGITRPDNRIINTRVGIRYRRNIHRDWLFFEMVPDITWPLTLSEDRETVLEERHSVLSLIFRLEIHFSTTKKRKYSDYIY